MEKVEDIIDYKGRLLSELRAKKKRKTSAKRKRTQKMDRELAKAKRKLWAEATQLGGDMIGRPICGLCGEPIRYLFDADICHEKSRGLGGGKRDDTKVFLGHRRGNRAQGSMSLKAYLSKYTLKERRLICQGKPIKGKA